QLAKWKLCSQKLRTGMMYCSSVLRCMRFDSRAVDTACGRRLFWISLISVLNLIDGRKRKCVPLADENNRSGFIAKNSGLNSFYDNLVLTSVSMESVEVQDLSNSSSLNFSFERRLDITHVTES
ncbi:hypothetical protein L9F63_005707, partial [Diploptera punctata]